MTKRVDFILLSADACSWVKESQPTDPGEGAGQGSTGGTRACGMGLAVLSARVLYRSKKPRFSDRALFFLQNARTVGRRLRKNRGGSESHSGSRVFLLGDAEGPREFSSALLHYRTLLFLVYVVETSENNLCLLSFADGQGSVCNSVSTSARTS